MSEVRVVIVDSSEERINAIKSCMPDYANAVAVGFGNAAMNAIRPQGSTKTDLVIMYADDSKGMGLYLFDWMKTKESELELWRIPVILLTADEFSDQCLDYLEIGDAFFYEGEIEEDRMYSVMMDALDTWNVEEIDPPMPAYQGEKSIDRVIGRCIKAPGGENSPVRAAVLNMEDDSRILNLEAALERGAARAELIRQMMAEALHLKEEMSAQKRAKSTVMNHVKKEHGISEDGTRVSAKVTRPAKPSSNPDQKVQNAAAIAGAISNHSAKDVDPLLAGIEFDENDEIFAGELFEEEKPDRDRMLRDKIHKIVVVDDDPHVGKMAKLFLQNSFEIIYMESGMKAIDFFIRNKADLILMDMNMPNLDGFRTLSSIRWQNNGRSVPVIYLLDQNDGIMPLPGDYVYGFIRKPLTRVSLMEALYKLLGV